jgi:hypothetical protein
LLYHDNRKMSLHTKVKTHLSCYGLSLSVSEQSVLCKLIKELLSVSISLHLQFLFFL